MKSSGSEKFKTMKVSSGSEICKTIAVVNRSIWDTSLWVPSKF